MKTFCHRLTWLALWVLALGTFTSISASALSHIFLIIPGFYFLYYYRDQKWSVSSWMLLGIILSIFLSVFANLDNLHGGVWDHIDKAKYFLIGFLSIFAFRANAEEFLTHKRVKWLLIFFVVATSVASLSGIIGLWSGFNPLKMEAPCHAKRACGLFGMYMTYGYGISLFMVLLTGALLYKDKFRQFFPDWLLPLAFIVNFAGLFLAYARGGWIGYLGAIPFFFFKEKKKWFFGIIGGVILLSSLTVALSPRVQKVVFERTGSNQQRISLFRSAFHAFNEKPFFGYGYRNFEPHVDEIKKRYDLSYKHFAGHAHNNFLEHLASTGFVGALFFILFHAFWLWETYKRNDVIGKIGFPFVVSFTLSGLFQYTFGDGENLFLIMGIYALTQLPEGIVLKSEDSKGSTA